MEKTDIVEIVYNETGYNEQPDITSRFGATVRDKMIDTPQKSSTKSHAVEILGKTGRSWMGQVLLFTNL